MLSVHARRGAIAKCGLMLFVVVGAAGCHNYNLNPHTTPPQTAKKTKIVPCDTKINADTQSGGVDLDAAFLCESDTVTWQIANGHTFHVKFTNGSPFVGNKSDFTDQDPSGKVKGQYNKLEVFKYTITVDNLNPIDPQVVGGGNP